MENGDFWVEVTGENLAKKIKGGNVIRGFHPEGPGKTESHCGWDGFQPGEAWRSPLSVANVRSKCVAHSHLGKCTQV